MSASKPVVLVLGGGSGIGRSTVEMMASRGANVIAADVDGGAAERTASGANANSGTVLAAQVDARRLDSVTTAVELACSRFGRLTAAVLSVFRDSPAPITELPESEWDDVLAVGLRSAYVLSKASLPVLGGAENPSLTFVSSIQASFGYQGMSAYSAAKAGLLGLVRQLAVEYGPAGVRVNAVLPALVITDRNRNTWEAQPELLERHSELFPLRRVGHPSDVASVICFLISEEARFVTGTSIPVDGGMAAQSAAAGQWHAYLQTRTDIPAGGLVDATDGMTKKIDSTQSRYGA